MCCWKITSHKLIHFRRFVGHRDRRALRNTSLFDNLLFSHLTLVNHGCTVFILSFPMLLGNTEAVHSTQLLRRCSHHVAINCWYHHGFRIINSPKLIYLFSLRFSLQTALAFECYFRTFSLTLSFCCVLGRLSI